MTNKIKFTYINEYANQVHDRPVPSSQILPQWVKDMHPYEISPNNPDGKTMEILSNGNAVFTNASAKKCSPMIDAMTGGYTVTLWTDVLVGEPVDGVANISWRVDSKVFTVHNRSSRDIPAPPGYLPQVMKYLPEFRVSTPPGYSVMIKPPAGFYDLPIVPLTAVVDTDKTMIDTNIGVWIREGFTGIIEKGTPIAQIFPFKREDWEAEFDAISAEQYAYDQDKYYSSTLVNNYVKNIRSNKKYS